tara:strand:+ start:10620 stop:10781 length:162 start_codon:yes stop_codon:yes gene_type:complete
MSEETISESLNDENIIVKKEEIESNSDLKITKVEFPSFDNLECMSKKFILSEN